MAPRRPVRRFPGVSAFSLLEILVSVAILAVILIALLSLLNMTNRSYTRTSGQMEAFETARNAFEALTRSLRQATLLSYLGYDNAARPTQYLLKSNLQFVSGPQDALGLEGTALASSHAVFFQAPLGVVESGPLRQADALLCATGFFVAWGKNPNLPDFLEEKDLGKPGYKLFQFVQPREQMSLYQYTLSETDGVISGNGNYSGTDWFKDAVNNLENCHVLADNVIALAILPLDENSAPVSKYDWNSRDLASPRSLHRLPRALRVAMVVIDQASMDRLGNPASPPALVPEGLFVDTSRFEADLRELEAHLAEYVPPLNYRIFREDVPLNAANAEL